MAELRWQKVVIGIDIDNIGNLEDLIRITVFNEESGNYKIVVESLLEIFTKKESDVSQAYRSPLCEKCYMRGYFFNKQLEYCEPVR